MAQIGIQAGWKLAVHFGLLMFVTVPLHAIELSSEDGVTVKGRVAQNNNQKLQVDFSDFPLSLREDLYDKLPTPKLPASWDEMDLEQRQDYAADFENSEAGKRLLAEREKLLDQANQFDVVLEKSGQFVVYDVPPGTYELRGRKDLKIGHYTYAFEVFGQVVVSPNVDEILLDPVMVLATPMYERGQPMPELNIDIFDGQKIVDKSSLKGKPILLSFWSAEFSPPSVEFQPVVQQMFTDLKDEHGLALISISLDPSRELASKTINEKGLQGYHGFAPGWENPTAEAFGVRALPFFLLIGPDQKILMTHGEIRQAFADGKSMGTLVGERLTGQDVRREEDKPGQANDGGK